MERQVMNIQSNENSMLAARWRPTLQQKETLEWFYRSGLNRPTAEEIERITSFITIYGTVEAKNVFYWFRNFKSKEKRLRKASELLDLSSGGSQATLSMTPSRSLLDILNEMESGNTVPDQGPSTLELFPLQPDHGGLQPVESSQFKPRCT